MANKEFDEFKRPFNKKEKIVTAISIFLLVVTLLVIAGQIAFSALNKAKNENFLKLESKVIMHYVPEELDVNLGNGGRQKCYIEPAKEIEKKDKNAFSTGILDALNIYYMDEKTNEKVYATTENTNALLLLTAKSAFLVKAGEKAKPILDTLKYLRIALIILDIIVFIYEIYLIWGKKYDERIAREKALSELTVKKRTGISEEEARVRPNNQKQYKKKKKKKK